MSIAQLPREVLEEVIWYTRESSRNDVYFCDLRLINHQFNEIVLYTLLCRAQSRENRRRHADHSGPCPSRKKRAGFPESTTVYARMQLQAQLNLHKAPCPSIARWHNSLRSAIVQLKDFLTQPNLQTAKELLDYDQRFYSTSAMPFFADKVSTLLCTAAVSILPMFNAPHYYTGAPTESVGANFWRNKPSFWIVVAAFYLGDIQLLDSLLRKPSPRALLLHPWGNLTACLCVAASQGHQHVLEYILHLHAFNDRYSQLVLLCAATVAGLKESVDLIVSQYPPDKVVALCEKTLPHLPRTPLSPSYSSALELLLKHTGPLPLQQIGWLLFQHAEVGAVDALRLLSTRYAPRWLYDTPPGHERNTLWKKAGTKDVSCQLVLAESGFFAMESPRKAVVETCREAVRTAIEQGRIDVAKGLSRFSGEDLYTTLPEEDSYIIAAGASDAGLDLLKACTQKHQEIWRYDSGYFARKVLTAAIQNLRPENVRFLMEQGVRTFWHIQPVQVTWSYRRTREDRYQAVQALLEEYALRPIVTLFPMDPGFESDIESEADCGFASQSPFRRNMDLIDT